MQTSNNHMQHFAATGTEKVTFGRNPYLLHISIPVGTTATFDFDGNAAESSVVPLALVAGFYTLSVSCAFVDVVVSGGTITGVAVAP